MKQQMFDHIVTQAYVRTVRNGNKNKLADFK